MKKLMLKNEIDLTLLAIHGYRVTIQQILPGNIHKILGKLAVGSRSGYPPKGHQEVIKFANESWSLARSRKELRVAITCKRTFNHLGICWLRPSVVGDNDIEIDIWIEESHRGKGYGSEAVKLLLKWASNEIFFDNLNYFVPKLNMASKRIIEALGGQISTKPKPIFLQRLQHYQIPYKTIKSFALLPPEMVWNNVAMRTRVAG